MSQARQKTHARGSAKVPKQRRTFTLSRESIALLNDLCVSRQGSRGRSVSLVLDELLRALDKQRRREAVDRATTNYYDGLSPSEQGEEREWGEFSLAQFMDGSA